MKHIARVVALGASNLARGFGTVVSTVRANWGPEVQILGAFGYGRSYGTSSRVVFRSLPGILESGLWETLESLPQVPTRVLITDVGNDVLYGFSAKTILTWVEEALNRVLPMTQDITLTGLPLENLRKLSKPKYLLFRTILFPKCRISLDQLLKSAEKLNAGLEALSINNSARFIIPNPAWYGVDPIHIRQPFWSMAWMEMLAANPATPIKPLADGFRLKLIAPERRWIFGIEQISRQSGISLSSGVRVWLF